jgi:hypothetical protein
MTKKLFPKGIIRIEVDGQEYDAEYMGRQSGFECMVCGKGENCHTFNILHSTVDNYYNKSDYETWGFGRDHLDHVKLISIRENLLSGDDLK